LLVQTFHIKARKGSDHISACEVGTRAPEYHSKEDYENSPSVKIETACSIIAHDLERDDIPPCVVDDLGNVTFPPLPPDAPAEFTQSRLFVVHMDFQRNTACLRSALWVLHKINAIILDGTTTHLQTRQEIVRRWKNRELNRGVPIRVLILTSVGRTGINLAAADRLLLMVRTLRECALSTRSMLTPFSRMCSGQLRINTSSLLVYTASLSPRRSMCTTSLCVILRMSSW
jgi:hypothetical protein